MNLEAAKRNASQAAINNWMRKQENVFKDEINRQLGTNHNTFNDAQRAYFKNFELQNNALNDRISSLASNYHTISNSINKTQETNTMQLFALDNFKNSAFADLKNIEINGKKIGDMASSSNANYELSMASLSVHNQFAAREYASAQNNFLGVGIYLLYNDQTMINDFVNQHINFYNSKTDLRDKVSLMTLYLTDHLRRNLGPIYYPPDELRIPFFSENDKLLNMGKAKTPNLNVEALVFAPNYIEDYNCYQRKPNPRGFNNTFTNAQCEDRKIELYAIKNRVIEEHKNALYIPGISLALKLYGEQWATIQDAAWLNMKSPFNASDLGMINKTTEYLKKNNDSQESLNFAKEAVTIYGKGTAKEKSFAEAIFSNNNDLATDILLENSTFTNAQCPPDCKDMVFDAPVDLTASILIGAWDGLVNIYLTSSIFNNYFDDGKEQQGLLIEAILKKSGIAIPDDIDHSILSEMFKVRSRMGEFKVEPANQDFLDTLGDLSISLLDVMTLVSLRSSSSAYLFTKTGGNITIKAVADYLKIISVTSSKVDGIINTLTSTAKYSLDGTGTFKNVAGHHPLAKIAFESDKFYNFRNAFSVSTDKLQAVWKTANPNSFPIDVHTKITGQQNSLYSAFAKTGDRLSLAKMAEIEIQAMVNVGIPRDIAEGWVIKSLQDLKTQGVTLITNIPWNGKN